LRGEKSRGMFRSALQEGVYVKQINVIPRHNAFSLSEDFNFEQLEAHNQPQIFPQPQQEASLTLETKFGSDAAIVQYSWNAVSDNSRVPISVRLKEKSLKVIDPKEMSVHMEWVILDWDLPSKGIRWDDPSKSETKEQIKDFMSAHAKMQKAYAYYFSKSGVRVLFHLANPLQLTTSEDVLLWKAFYREFVEQIDISEIGGEIERRTDPFILSRVPNYVDSGTIIEGEIVYLNTQKSVKVEYPKRESIVSPSKKVASAVVFNYRDSEVVTRLLDQDPLIQHLKNTRMAVHYSDWRALGTNIAALYQDKAYAFEKFKEISQWDPNYTRHSDKDLEYHWNYMLQSLDEAGPITWPQWSADFDLKSIYGSADICKNLVSKINKQAKIEQDAKNAQIPQNPNNNIAAVDAMLEKKTVQSGGRASLVNKKSLLNLKIILLNDNRWQGKIRRNHLGQVDMLGDSPLVDEDITFVREAIANNYALTYSKDEVWDFIKMIASINEYNPVADYFGTLQWDGVDRIGGLAKSLGHSDAFSCTILKKFLISAVVRPLEWSNTNGSVNWKIDTVLILKGGQGKRKSSFFKALCSDEEWFSDSLPSLTHDRKDASMHMLGKWIVEQAEFEGHVARSSVEMMKAFITREREIFRKPYGRSEINMRRPSILVGTTNSSSFLNDPTGDRRFWVLEIPEEHTIDIAWVNANRDQLWSQAVELYRQGESWWLTDVETAQSNQRNSKFRRPDALHEAVLEFLNSNPTMSNLSHDELYEDDIGFTFKQLVTIGLDKKLAEMKSFESVSVHSFLEKQGYVKNRIRVNGKRMYVFRKLRDFELQDEHED
jgi:predicted P-loop ATPase